MWLNNKGTFECHVTMASQAIATHSDLRDHDVGAGI